MNENETPPIGPPTSTAKKYAQYILGFGVWFALGLAPFLGKVKVPGFDHLLELYPADLARILIPISGLLMGMLAVTVEFAATGGVARRTLKRWFVRGVAIFAAALITLLVIYPFLIIRVEFTVARATTDPPTDRPPDRVTVAFVTGTLEVPRHPPGSDCRCPEGQPADQCISDVSLNPMNVRRCFGAQRIAFASLAFSALYLMLTGSFAAAVGLLILFQREQRKEKPKKRRAAAPARV